jgi:hypothetical protein
MPKSKEFFGFAGLMWVLVAMGSIVYFPSMFLIYVPLIELTFDKAES